MRKTNLSKRVAMVVLCLMMSCTTVAGTVAFTAASVTVAAASKTTKKSKVVSRKVGSYKGANSQTTTNSRK